MILLVAACLARGRVYGVKPIDDSHQNKILKSISFESNQTTESQIPRMVEGEGFRGEKGQEAGGGGRTRSPRERATEESRWA